MVRRLQPGLNAPPFSYLNLPHRESMDLLFQRVKNDDYSAFEKIFKNNYRALCSYSNQLVISPQLAEEIVDDVFFNLWRNRKKIHITSSFQSYLIISIRNRSLDCLRKLKGEKQYLLEHAESVQCKQSIAYEVMVYEELCHHIDTAVNDLPEQCRLVFQLSRDQGLPYKEIARVLNISIKTVDTQIGRALKYIRKIIAAREV
ncbi:MAG: RNA polymerase sigma-70 factor [Cyclobacteriaceae bacterium]